MQPFEPYNARFADPGTVAETFVLRKVAFASLCEQNNSLLIGPRGSGKTTLLKMLKVSAQIKWKNKRQSMFLRRFTFAPIYVGADRLFDLVIGNLQRAGFDENSFELVAKCLLSFRIKFACLDTARELGDPKLENAENLSHQYVRLDVSIEAQIAKELSVAWKLDEQALSLLEVRSQLRSQLAEVNRFVDRMKFGEGVTVRELLDYNQFFSHDPIYTCQSFIDVFNLAIHKPNKIWALCIDEVEIMPPFLQRYLFACFRSVDQRIVLKYATSPFSAIDWDQTQPTRPMAGHDFTPINLSFSKKNEARRFSAELMEALLISEMNLDRNREKYRPRGTDVLGRSPISEANSGPQQRNAYKPPSGEHFVRFKQLREVDAGFRRFLDERRIVIENIHEEEETKRAGQARKYIWSVAVRLEYGPNNIFRRKDNTISERPPSRKTIPTIYLGYDSLMAICEGNPRTTISLLRPLVRYYSGTSKSVPHEVQSELLRTAMAKYLSLLSTIPLQDPKAPTEPNGTVVDLIDEIGEFFSQEVNGHKFKAEPSLTIRIDRDVPQAFVAAIGNAMNQGAFVMLADQAGLFDFGSLQGARLRLSYLLCPRYHIPLTVGQSGNLSNILKQQTPRRRPHLLSMDDLFEGEALGS